MAILAKKTGGGIDLGPLAPAGMYSAVCVDAIDLGILDSTFSGVTKKKWMARVIWQVADETGRRFLVAKRYNVTLNEKSTLRKDLQSWFSRPVTRDMEEKGFDIEKLVGHPCQLLIVHAVKADRTYANVESVMPRDKKSAPLKAAGYTRQQIEVAAEEEHDDDPFAEDTAVAEVPAAFTGGAATPPAITDDDIPF